MVLLLSLAHAADTWSTVATGVRLLKRTTSEPLRIFAVEADLCTPGARFRATTSGERADQTSDFAESVDAVAAVNGDFFSYEDYDTSGLAVGDGVAWSSDNTSEGFIVGGRDHAWISPPSEDWSTLASWMHEAVGGRPQLVIEGVAQSGFTDPSHCSDLHPRTAVGLSRDRQTLYMVVVDGRSSQSDGIDCDDLADLMVDLGAETALNLDGGGSSTLWTASGGVENDPSDGSERVVGNHLALVIDGSAPAESCDWWQQELVLGAHLLDGGPTDVEGDGRGDLCARSSTDFRCVTAGGATLTIPDLSNDAGFSSESAYSTIRTGDIDGDGLADVCARSTEGVRCFRANGAGFDAAITGPEWSDAAGWDDIRYFSTFRLADFNGDGRDDACARAGAGLWCYPSTGAGFGERVDGPGWADSSGWDDPEHYGTIRFGDIDGDGRDDVCARANAGMSCYLSDGNGFPTAVSAPAWDDDHDFDQVMYWSTIRLDDVDGDGRAELCAREAEGWRCYRYEAGSFGEALVGPELSDASGWNDHSNYATIQQADVDADGDLDVCARANAGVYCWLYQDGAWATRVDGPALSDDGGWDDWAYYSTIRLADVDGDARADLCARYGEGVRCHLSTGTGFGDALEGPEWADALGWDDVAYYSTIRSGGSAARPPAADTGQPGDSAGYGSEGPPSATLTPAEDDACGCEGGGGAAAFLARAALRRNRGRGGVSG